MSVTRISEIAEPHRSDCYRHFYRVVPFNGYRLSWTEPLRYSYRRGKIGHFPLLPKTEIYLEIY